MTHPQPKFRATEDHKILALHYAQLRDVCGDLGQLQDCDSAFSEDERKQLDLAQVCLRLGYKRIKRLLRKAGAECGRRKLNR